MLRIRDGFKNLGSSSKRLASAASQSCGAVGPRHVELLLNYVDSQHPEHLQTAPNDLSRLAYRCVGTPLASEAALSSGPRPRLAPNNQPQTSTFTPTSFMPQRVPNRSSCFPPPVVYERPSREAAGPMRLITMGPASQLTISEQRPGLRVGKQMSSRSTY
jgi:hypothetical protein